MWFPSFYSFVPTSYVWKKKKEKEKKKPVGEKVGE